MADCELCKLAVEPVYHDDRLSVILVDDAAYPGFCRVIWKEHVREMSDLSREDRSHLNEAVVRVEAAVRAVLQPHKMNVASLGNMVPHLHWHVIPRFEDDAHFPHPVWAQAVRMLDDTTLAPRRALLPQLAGEIVRRMEQA
jgi:diadenosine tetraphosphate (Ap4A) HIT family hydrolase